MRNNEYNLFVSEKKKPSFAEWTMKNGVSLNQTTQKPLTLGEVAPKATERATSSASTTTQTRDPFLEGFYSTEDKPETERKTYLQHRTPAVETVETKKPEKINLPYRPSVQGQPKITQYGKQPTNPYGSPVKIVGNNVTEKDYEDFWNAFRNEGAGDKLNWSAGQMKPQSDTKAYWHEGQPWMTSATETDDYRKKAGREYAQNIIDDLFYGDSNLRVGDYPKVIDPVTQSKYREILENESYSRANAEYLAGIKTALPVAASAIANAYAINGQFARRGLPSVDKLILGTSIVGGTTQAVLDEGSSGLVRKYNDLYNENNAKKQYGQMLDYIEGSDYKYLADWDKSREKYIEDLQKEVEKLEEAEQLGYLPPRENEIFKEEAINELKRIIYLNQNYDTFSKIRDRELSDAARLD